MTENKNYDSNFGMFVIGIARELGHTDATMLNYIYRWCLTNKHKTEDGEKRNNLHENAYWTYDSVNGISEKLAFTVSQVRTSLKHLEEKGLIKISNFNKLGFDRTKWYTLTEKAEDLFRKYLGDDYESILIKDYENQENDQNCQSICDESNQHLSSIANAFATDSETIPYINSDNNTYNTSSDSFHSSLAERKHMEKEKLLKESNYESPSFSNNSNDYEYNTGYISQDNDYSPKITNIFRGSDDCGFSQMETRPSKAEEMAMSAIFDGRYVSA